ncbi:hypothetical protein EVAR_26527_1 [Eumeta japonica]|uniref:Uncharacterized protein n=1 Tax=Eumeta variegata TaxID=151549 RepID=A0A4C1V8S6_EUMVA|nr:hypothetical protein EVAR_26527_1 [Eumeta japonica]
MVVSMWTIVINTYRTHNSEQSPTQCSRHEPKAHKKCTGTIFRGLVQIRHIQYTCHQRLLHHRLHHSGITRPYLRLTSKYHSTPEEFSS